MTNLERIELFTCKHRKRHPIPFFSISAITARACDYTIPSFHPLLQKDACIPTSSHYSNILWPTKFFSPLHILILDILPSYLHPTRTTSYLSIPPLLSPRYHILSSTDRPKVCWKEIFSPTQKFSRDNFTVDRIIVASKGGGDVVALQSSLWKWRKLTAGEL